jgi:Ca-activated chloride channel family protein
VIARALEAAGIQALAHPGWLLLLVPLVVAALAAALRAPAPALGWPHIAEARRAGARRIDPARLGAFVLRAGALLALALVLAAPVGVHRAPPEPGYGLDMSLVLDASGSMRALDARVDGEWRTRLDLAREVVARFAERRAQEGDRVALIVFGETSMTQCPLTSDGALLSAALRRVEAGMVGEATALGDALALAVKRVGGAGGALPGSGSGGPLAGRLVVLLTDGRHNAGSLSLEAATSLAAASGVRVHTVAIGSAGEAVPMQGPGGDLHFERHDIDVGALAAIASATGGRFFAADRSADLEQVYREIDSLERVARRLPPRVRHVDRPEPFLALAGVFLLGEIAVGRVLRRRLP